MNRSTSRLLAAVVLTLTGCRASEPGSEIGKPADSSPSPAAVVLPDAVTAAPAHYRVLEQAPRARMLVARWQPGETDAAHSHPTVLWYALTDANLRIEGFGPPFVRAIAAGDSGVQDPLAGHTITNLGPNEAKILMFEIAPGPVATLGFAAAEPPAEPADAGFDVLESTADYRLLHTTLQPGARSRAHSHPDLLWYALTEANVMFETVEPEPTFFRSEAGGHGRSNAVRSHFARNLAPAPVRWLALELAQSSEPASE